MHSRRSLLSRLLACTGRQAGSSTLRRMCMRIPQAGLAARQCLCMHMLMHMQLYTHRQARHIPCVREIIADQQSDGEGWQCLLGPKAGICGHHHEGQRRRVPLCRSSSGSKHPNRVMWGGCWQLWSSVLAAAASDHPPHAVPPALAAEAGHRGCKTSMLRDMGNSWQPEPLRCLSTHSQLYRGRQGLLLAMEASWCSILAAMALSRSGNAASSAT